MAVPGAMTEAVWLEPEKTTLQKMHDCDPDSVTVLKLHAWGWRWGSYLADIKEIAFFHDCEVTSCVDKNLWKQNILAQITGKTSDLILFYKECAKKVSNLEDVS